MSNNKGKDGEMVATKALCDISLNENNCDFIRSTTTNTPDQGADLMFYCPENTGEKLSEIAEKGTSDITLSGKGIQVRIDVKAKGKIQKDDVEKFLNDVKKHPHSKEHWMLGPKISGPAKNLLDESGWVKTRFFSDEGIQKIVNFYQSLPKPDEDSK